jgi:CRP-like cAMP-binding protein
LLEEHPEISQNIMQMLTRRLRRLLAMPSADDKAVQTS